MSSLRNAAPRLPHRERAQPQSRQRKYGLLEKHKDYSLRAADYNLKKKKLAQLSAKARDRHPDEFAFGMLSEGKGKAGKHGIRDQQQNRLSHDAVKLLKRQDAGYLRVVMAKGRKELEKLKEVVGLDGVLVDEEDSNGLTGSERLLRFEDGDSEDLHLTDAMNRGISGDEDGEIEVRPVIAMAQKQKSRKHLAAEQDAFARLQSERKRRRRLQEVRVAKLEALKKRQREIMAVADQLEVQRAKMAGTIGGVNRNGVKFKVRERKK